MRAHLTFAAAVFAAAAFPAAALGEPRPETSHVKVFEHVAVHYNAGWAGSSESEIQLTGEVAEKSWNRLVAGGSTAPNVGFRRPPADGAAGGGQDLLDIYIAPAGQFDGGFVPADENGYPFIWISPKNRGDDGIRGLLGHEFFHAIQPAYATPGGMLTESSASWASALVHPLPYGGDEEWMLRADRLPMDCSYGTWPRSGGVPCGNGYRQSLFLQQVTGRLGEAVVRHAYELAEALEPQTAGRAFADDEAEGLRRAIAAAGSDISQQFRLHVVGVNDPTRSPIEQRIRQSYAYGGAPGEKVKTYDEEGLHYLDDPAGLIGKGKARNSGSQALPHLAYRTVRLRRPPGAPKDGEKLRITVTSSGQKPAATSVPTVLTGRAKYGRRKPLKLKRLDGRPLRWQITIPFGVTEALVGQPLLLFNDSLDRDGVRFGWKAKVVR